MYMMVPDFHAGQRAGLHVFIKEMTFYITHLFEALFSIFLSHNSIRNSTQNPDAAVSQH